MEGWRKGRKEGKHFYAPLHKRPLNQGDFWVCVCVKLLLPTPNDLE